MARNPGGDESDAPEGGKAAARLRQFLEARGMTSDDDSEEKDDIGQDGQGREDHDEDGGG